MTEVVEKYTLSYFLSFLVVTINRTMHSDTILDRRFLSRVENIRKHVLAILISCVCSWQERVLHSKIKSRNYPELSSTLITYRFRRPDDVQQPKKNHHKNSATSSTNRPTFSNYQVQATTTTCCKNEWVRSGNRTRDLLHPKQESCL